MRRKVTKFMKRKCGGEAFIEEKRHSNSGANKEKKDTKKKKLRKSRRSKQNKKRGNT